MLGRHPSDRYVMWLVPKLKIELSRRNASTQGHKTNLVERYTHYSVAFFERQLYYSFFCMNKGDHKFSYIANIQQAQHLQNVHRIWLSSSLGGAYFFTRAI